MLLVKFKMLIIPILLAAALSYSCRSSPGKTASFQDLNPSSLAAHSISSTSDLQNILSARIELLKSDSVSDISLYFYSFSDSTGFGINDDELYAPASLAKVPIMIAFYKMAESDESLLNRKVAIPATMQKPFVQSYADPDNIKAGGTYSINQLINNMIIKSDNMAMQVLKDYIRPMNYRPLNSVYYALKLPFVKDSSDENSFSSGIYATTFIALYKASYLDRALSGKALDLLKRSEFAEGLCAGLPPEIKVAHKFGERGYLNNNQKQLHECGIIFYTPHPYLLCIMTRGQSLHSQAAVLKRLSMETYNCIVKQQVHY